MFGMAIFLVGYFGIRGQLNVYLVEWFVWWGRRLVAWGHWDICEKIRVCQCVWNSGAGRLQESVPYAFTEAAFASPGQLGTMKRPQRRCLAVAESLGMLVQRNNRNGRDESTPTEQDVVD